MRSCVTLHFQKALHRHFPCQRIRAPQGCNGAFAGGKPVVVGQCHQRVFRTVPYHRLLMFEPHRHVLGSCGHNGTELVNGADRRASREVRPVANELGQIRSMRCSPLVEPRKRVNRGFTNPSILMVQALCDNIRRAYRQIVGCLGVQVSWLLGDLTWQQLFRRLFRLRGDGHKRHPGATANLWVLAREVLRSELNRLHRRLRGMMEHRKCKCVGCCTSRKPILAHYDPVRAIQDLVGRS
mmetsp:Transcript_111503/g.314836  ORF Transcript_111503/g.314836 Transcript_111503/m.314836 type:complete len:239 (-) Transcript_111503:217-933(-)